MSKERISYDDLLEKVQGIVDQCSECHDIHVDSLQVYREDVAGANWDITSWRKSGDDNDLEECMQSVKSQILQLRQQYDISE